LSQHLNKSQINRLARILNKLTELEAKKEKIEREITTASPEQKFFLIADLEEITKQIKNYHDSFGWYRKNQKKNNLTEMAGGKRVAEVYQFKTRQKEDKNNPKLELGEKFLKDLEDFKTSKRDSGGMLKH